jgi:hypothetical protein
MVFSLPALKIALSEAAGKDGRGAGAVAPLTAAHAPGAPSAG